MMLKLPHKSIMRKNIKLPGQPIACQLVSFVPDHLIEEAVAFYKSDHNYKITTQRRQMVLSASFGITIRTTVLRKQGFFIFTKIIL